MHANRIEKVQCATAAVITPGVTWTLPTSVGTSIAERFHQKKVKTSLNKVMLPA